MARSSLYETSPVDHREQPSFLNDVIEVRTSLEPLDLLRKIKSMEKEFNRMERIPKGPRYIDIDILLFNDLKIEDEILTIPHPSLCRRKFVLVPLLEISPHQFCVRDNRSLRECLRLLDDSTQEVRPFRG